MKPTQDHYPVFEVNQVLSSGHLNDLFNYLDDQQRLTRTNLIGIGIVCGLDIQLDTRNGVCIKLSKGCGVTSQGYLLIEPEDLKLQACREAYLVPTEWGDTSFIQDATKKTQYPLWELLETGDMKLSEAFLQDKAVLLFLEQKKQGLRNCSANNCDNQGMAVSNTLKRLLIRRDDLNLIIAASHQLASGLTLHDLEATLLERFKLPDLRMPRYAVPNTDLVSSNDVLAAFLAVFHNGSLVSATSKALTAAYAAFKPLLENSYPLNPFAEFDSRFGFLEQVPTTSEQVRFLPYYYDFFGDLLCAYDEFRWKAAELICACCPDEKRFPRYLLLGLVYPDKASQAGLYRQTFLPSSVSSGCTERASEVQQCFQRLVEMCNSFSHKPTLPNADVNADIDPQIRITPSVLGNQPLANKAIPYYYRQNGTPPLYQLWSREKTRRYQANQNLAYRSDEYSPLPPNFIRYPLAYDLDAYNFLRIEGHLGKDYQRVLHTLLALKAKYRLPIDIVALRSGAYDDDLKLNLVKESCQFQDLEALYEALREEQLSALCERVRYFYDMSLVGGGSAFSSGKPRLALLQSRIPEYVYPAGSVGAWYENNLNAIQAKSYIDLDANKLDDSSVLSVCNQLLSGTNANALPEANKPHVLAIYYAAQLANRYLSQLSRLDYANFENGYQDFLGLIRYLRNDTKLFRPQEDVIDHYDEILFSNQLESIKSIYNDYQERIRELKQKQFLLSFLRDHPGIQHKAGVPLGGTFILVYHDSIASSQSSVAPSSINSEISASYINSRIVVSSTGANTNRGVPILYPAANRSSELVEPDYSSLRLGKSADSGIANAINELKDGAIIADFYLPYLCSTGRSPLQFVVPKIPPKFTAQIGCTTDKGDALLTVTPTSGMPPYAIKVDNGNYQALSGTLLLHVGEHSLQIRDAENTESIPQTVVIPANLSLSKPLYQCNQAYTAYTATFIISGGTPPYTVNGNTILKVNNEYSYTTELTASGNAVTVEVTDSKACKTSKTVKKTCCALPCEGISLRRGYLFWFTETDKDRPYEKLVVEKLLFSFEYPQGSTVDLSTEVRNIIGDIDAADLNNDFALQINKWLEQINKLIAATTGKPNWITLTYESRQPGFLGILWIEYLECLKFDFNVYSVFSHVNETGINGLQVTYQPEHTAITHSLNQVAQPTITVPAFDTSKIEQCNPQNPAENWCIDKPDLTLAFTGNAGSNWAHVRVDPQGAEAPVAYLWEVQDGIPAMSNQPLYAYFNFTRLKPNTKLVRITVFTQRGCRVSQDNQITLG